MTHLSTPLFDQPHSQGGKLSKHLGVSFGCKDKNSPRRDLIGSPTVVACGQQYNVGEKPTVILYTYISPSSYLTPKHRQKRTTNNLYTTHLCYLDFGLVGETELIIEYTRCIEFVS